MIRALYGLEPQGGDVSQTCPLWLLIHRTLMKFGSLGAVELTTYTCTTGKSVIRTLGWDSISLQPRRSHPAPSRYSP